MELTLFRFSKELVLVQAPKHFPNVLDVVLHIVRIDQDVVKVYYHADIEHICKDRVDKSLESGRGIGETKGHHLPFIGAIVSTEGSFPLIALSDANQMVSMPKIDFSVDLRLTRGVKEVGDEGSRVPILLEYFIKSLVVDAQLERAILLLDEEDRGCVGG